MQQPSLNFDTIVIGAGIVGSACAYKIAKSGQRTLLLDQFPLGHVHGSSHGASRIIRCTHSDPLFLPFALDAYKEWDALHAIDEGPPLVVSNGLLTMDMDLTQTLLRAEILRRFGVRCEVLRGGDAIQRRFPHLANYDEKWTAVYEPDAGTLLAENCLKAVQRQFLAQAGRAVMRMEEQVLAIRPRKRSREHPDEHPIKGASFTVVEVITNRSKYLAKHVVVAAGGWLPRLLPGLPLKTTAHLIGINYWRVKSRPQLYRPENGSPNLVICDDQGQVLYGLPGTDYPDAMKFGIHLGLPVEDLSQRLSERLPEWMQLIPAKHLARHFPDLDTSEPLAKSTYDGRFELYH